jgi:hypothetical protein
VVPSTREASVQNEHEPQPEAAGDYEYDEAHDAADPYHAAYVDAKSPQPAEVHITTGPINQDGDYGYDMAHDVPP